MSFLTQAKLLVGLLLRYLLRGVFLFLPAIATFYLLWLLLKWLDSIIPTGIPGIGIVLLLLGLTVLGYIGTHWLGPTLIAAIEERIRKIPFIGFIYSSVRELVESSRRSFRFDRPVLVQVNPQVPLYQIGFLTHDAPLPDQPLAAVYLPYAFGFMGDLVLVPASQIQPLALKASDTLRFIIAGGLIPLRNNEGESPQEGKP